MYILDVKMETIEVLTMNTCMEENACGTIHHGFFTHRVHVGVYKSNISNRKIYCKQQVLSDLCERRNNIPEEF